jgi:hypothetical protein
MENTYPLKVGTQIVYFPSHVREECGNDFDKMIAHPDKQFGFVSSWREETVFCRYWHNHSERYENTMRTLANSEGCSWRDIEVYNGHSVYEVERLLEMFRADPERYGWNEQRPDVEYKRVRLAQLSERRCDLDERIKQYEDEVTSKQRSLKAMRLSLEEANGEFYALAKEIENEGSKK